MKLHVNILLFALFCIAQQASAGTDYKCMSDCSGRGYTWQYCNGVCSYSNQSPQSPQINWQILDPNTPAKVGESFQKGQEQARQTELQRLQIEEQRIRLERQKRQLEQEKNNPSSDQSAENVSASEAFNIIKDFVTEGSGNNMLRLIRCASVETANGNLHCQSYLYGYVKALRSAQDDSVMKAYVFDTLTSGIEKRKKAGEKITSIESNAIACGKTANLYFLGAPIQESATNQQIVLIVEKYLQGNPEKLHGNAYALSVEALKNAFRQNQNQAAH